VKSTKNYRRTSTQAALFAGSAIVFGALVAANPFSAAADTGREDASSGSSDTSTSAANDSQPSSTTGEPRPTTGEPKPATAKPKPTTNPEPITSNPEPITSNPGAIAPNPGAISVSSEPITNHSLGGGSIAVDADKPTGTVLMAPGADSSMAPDVWKPTTTPKLELDPLHPNEDAKVEGDSIWVPGTDYTHVENGDLGTNYAPHPDEKLPPQALESQHAAVFNLFPDDKHLRPGVDPFG
jgi:hypothetical protein